MYENFIKLKFTKIDITWILMYNIIALPRMVVVIYLEVLTP